MAEKLTIKRNPSGVHTVLRDGVPVGEVWRRPEALGFGLRLTGYFWINGSANTRSGLTTTSAKRMKDALALAQQVLDAS